MFAMFPTIISFYFASTLPLLNLYRISTCSLSAISATIPADLLHIPMLGMPHSQRGNVSFPPWECFLSHSQNRLYPVMLIAYAPNGNGLTPLMRIELRDSRC